MTRITEIAFTAYPVTNIPRARAFYEGLLELNASQVIEHEGKHWIEYALGPTTLAINNLAQDKTKPSPHGPSAALEVEDFDATIDDLRDAGVEFTLEPITESGCRRAVITDPDGNSLALHHRASP